MTSITVPFAALHDGTRFLADAYDITYVTSGRDLLRRNTDIAPSRSVVALVDPAFDAAITPSPSSPDTGQASSLPEPRQRYFALERLFTQDRGWLDQPLKPLPGTRQEAEALHRLIPETRILAGPAATKKALLELSTPGILHIGTHGAFLQDSSPAPSPATWAMREIGLDDLPSEKPRYIPPEPLLWSAFVLAGIQAPAASGDTDFSRIETSLVTALEAASLNLWGTSSSCCPHVRPAKATSKPAKASTACAVPSPWPAPRPS